MIALREKVEAGFHAAFGDASELIAAAPGRVNLIGEHTDYNDGFVLPMTIGVGTLVAARRRTDGVLRVAALDLGETTEFPLSSPVPHAPVGNWSNYVRGVAAALAESGLALAGADLAIAGNVPQGAGLSSSASLEVATGLALAALAGAPGLDRTALALAGQSAEHHYAGCQCGIMDQLVSARAEAGNAVLIDCRDLSARSVAMDAELAVLIVHSGIRRGLVDGEYNLRRLQCEAAAAAMQVPALRDADPATLVAARAAMDPIAYRRARHVITENARTLAAADALTAGDLASLGCLMSASHASMRDDFEITTPDIDRLAAQMAQFLGNRGGARMTGGGFGGAVIAIARRSAIEALRDEVGCTYRTPAGAVPQMMIEVPEHGARLL